MKTYKVTITETLQRTIEVRADSYAAALELVEEGYAASEYILDSSDFNGVKFHATAKSRDQESR